MSPPRNGTPTNPELDQLFARFDTLDQHIAELRGVSKELALMQQQIVQQGMESNEIKGQIKETISSFNNSFGRVHARLDDNMADATRRVEIAEQKTDVLVKDLTAQVLRLQELIYLEISKVNDRITSLEKEDKNALSDMGKENKLAYEALKDQLIKVDAKVQEWINKGWGVWKVAGVVSVVVWALLGWWLSDLNSDRRQMSTAILEIRDSNKVASMQLINQQTIITELVSNQKVLAAGQRGLEDTIFRQARLKEAVQDAAPKTGTTR